MNQDSVTAFPHLRCLQKHILTYCLALSAGELSWGRIDQYSCQHIQPLHVQLCVLQWYSGIRQSKGKHTNTSTMYNKVAAIVCINKQNYLILFKLYQRQSRPSSPVRLPSERCPVILFVSVMHPFSHRVFRRPLHRGPLCPPTLPSETHKHTLLIIWGGSWLKLSGRRVQRPVFIYPHLS